LSDNDVFYFLSALSQEELKNLYETKKIYLSTWVRTMKKINDKLTNNYVVFRRGKWGENTGRRALSDENTKYLIPLFRFGKLNALTCFESLNPYSFSFLILLEDNKFKNVNKNIDKLSSWDIKDYKLPNELYS
jgi:hypothetical protein